MTDDAGDGRVQTSGKLRSDNAQTRNCARRLDPARQKGGVGKALIDSAESYAREHGCRFMDIRIVNLRVELPAFYRKLGYADAGTEEFTPGAPTKLPCHFIKMQKELG